MELHDAILDDFAHEEQFRAPIEAADYDLARQKIAEQIIRLQTFLDTIR